MHRGLADVERLPTVPIGILMLPSLGNTLEMIEIKEEFFPHLFRPFSRGPSGQVGSRELIGPKLEKRGAKTN